MFNTVYNDERPPPWEEERSIVMAKFVSIFYLFVPGDEERFFFVMSCDWKIRGYAGKLYFDGNNKNQF